MPTPNKEAEESWALEAKPPPPYDGSHRYLKSEVAHLLAENQRLREALKQIRDHEVDELDIYDHGAWANTMAAAALNPSVSLKEK